MIQDFVPLIPDSLLTQSGSVFYSGRSAFGEPSKLYILGLNPGGSPEVQAAETVAWHTKKVLEIELADWSAYKDERWAGSEPGARGLQPRVLHLLHKLDIDPRRVPSSNVVFLRSARESGLNDQFLSLAEACWPFHQSVIKRLGIKVILCFGQRAGDWVCGKLGAYKKIDEFVEKNNRRWKSSAFINHEEIAVIVATHPSIADWKTPASDPTSLVQRIMMRQRIKETSPDSTISFARNVASEHLTDRYATFRRLHESGCFVIPNPWDIGGAKLLEQLGFKALATTSSGFAWSQGKRDNLVPIEDVLAHLRAIAGSVSVPVNADFEGGFAVEPKSVAANVSRAAATGVAGLSIEDSSGNETQPLFDFSLAVERIHAARLAIEETGYDVLLTARCEGFLVGRPDLPETIHRLTAYAEAGADCLYAPGLRELGDIEAVVKAVAPKSVNVLIGGDFTTAAQLADLGVRRISVGGALARAAWRGFLDAAREIAEQGTFTRLSQAIPHWEIDGRFR